MLKPYSSAAGQSLGTCFRNEGWLSLHPNRFEFVFTPKSTASTYTSDQIDAGPVIDRWKFKMDEIDIGWISTEPIIWQGEILGVAARNHLA